MDLGLDDPEILGLLESLHRKLASHFLLECEECGANDWAIGLGECCHAIPKCRCSVPSDKWKLMPSTITANRHRCPTCKKDVRVQHCFGDKMKFETSVQMKFECSCRECSTSGNRFQFMVKPGFVVGRCQRYSIGPDGEGIPPTDSAVPMCLATPPAVVFDDSPEPVPAAARADKTERDRPERPAKRLREQVNTDFTDEGRFPSTERRHIGGGRLAWSEAENQELKAAVKLLGPPTLENKVQWEATLQAATHMSCRGFVQARARWRLIASEENNRRYQQRPQARTVYAEDISLGVGQSGGSGANTSTPAASRLSTGSPDTHPVAAPATSGSATAPLDGSSSVVTSAGGKAASTAAPWSDDDIAALRQLLDQLGGPAGENQAQWEAELANHPVLKGRSFAAARKKAYNFGWDQEPALVSSPSFNKDKSHKDIPRRTSRGAARNSSAALATATSAAASCPPTDTPQDDEDGDDESRKSSPGKENQAQNAEDNAEDDEASDDEMDDNDAMAVDDSKE